MGTVRVCGATCHNAKKPACRCWCGGIFHGRGGQEAREAFAREFGVDTLPTTEKALLEVTGQGDLFAEASSGSKWRHAIGAAVEARRAADAQRAAVRRDRVSRADSPGGAVV